MGYLDFEIQALATTIFSKGYESEANGAGRRAQCSKPKDFSPEFVVYLAPCALSLAPNL